MRSDDPDVMFVTDNFSGVNKSTDGGLTWSPSNAGITAQSGVSLDAIPVFTLNIDPNDDDRMWVGTSMGAGIYRSDDGGESWTLKAERDDDLAVVFRGFGVTPGNSDVVYAAGEVPSWEWAGHDIIGPDNLDCTMGVVYKSTDAGAHWTRIWYGNNLARYVLIDPRNPNRLYVSTGIFDRNSADANWDPEDPDPRGVGLLRSDDGGETWEVLAENNGFDPDELWIGSLVMDPTNPDVLFAGSGNLPFGMLLGPLGGVYRTTDGGDTWTETLDQGGISAVEVCEGNPDVVYAASIDGVWRSADGGVTWVERSGHGWGSDGMVAGFPIDALCDPRDENRLFINNYGGGNFLTEDGGATWILASQGYTGALMADVAVRADPGAIVASARSGLFAWDGEAWRGIGHDVARSMEAFGISVDPFDDDHLLATVVDSSPEPLESFDGGVSWHNVILGVPHDRSVVAEVVFSPGGAMFGLEVQPACWKGHAPERCPEEPSGPLWVTWDGWETFEDAVPGATGPLSVVFAPSDSEVGYAFFWATGVYRTGDGGETWAFAGDPGVDWMKLAVDGEDPDRILGGSGTGGILVSEDGGATWDWSSAGLDPEAAIAGVVADPLRSGVAYAASPMTGVFYTTDGGDTWTAHNTGLRIKAANSLALSADGEVLYAATEGSGVSRLGTPR